MPVLIVLIVGDALIGMHHVHQAVSLIAVLGPAPDLVRDLQDVSAAAFHLQHVAKGRSDALQPFLPVGKHKALAAGVLHVLEQSPAVIDAQGMVHHVRQQVAFLPGRSCLLPYFQQEPGGAFALVHPYAVLLLIAY